MLKKIIFKNEVKEILLDHILKGNVSPGERISLPKVASELEVSVTPIREALTQLSETGIVTYIANRGFFVTELRKREAKETYELMALLEGNAIKNSSYNSDQLSNLRKINSAFINAKTTRDKLDFDRIFHQKLIENYTNESACKIIEDLRVRISLYEYAFWNDNQGIESEVMHEKMINHLASNDKTSAIKLVKRNWIISIKHIINSIEKSDLN